MVLLHFKNSELDQFLFEAPAARPVADVARDLAEVHNLRRRVARLGVEGAELAKYGPSKPPGESGAIDKYLEDEEEEKGEGQEAEGGLKAAGEGAAEEVGGSEGASGSGRAAAAPARAKGRRGEHYCMDPTGRRTGDACDPAVAKKLLDELAAAEAAASKARAARREPLTKAGLLEAIDGVRGAVMICYPMGLPDWDPVRLCLEGREEGAAAGSGSGEDEGFDPGACQLWFASRALDPSKALSDYLGRNERTRAVVKMTHKGAGAPAREPAVDAETQKAMLAFYHKRQEQQKRLDAAAEDDDCDVGAPSASSTARWADPRALKQHFAGVTSVRVPR